MDRNASRSQPALEMPQDDRVESVPVPDASGQEADGPVTPPISAAPPLPGQPGYNWVLHGDSHPDLSGIVWPVAQAIRTVRDNQEVLRGVVNGLPGAVMLEELNGRIMELEQTMEIVQASIRMTKEAQGKTNRQIAVLGRFLGPEAQRALQAVAHDDTLARTNEGGEVPESEGGQQKGIKELGEQVKELKRNMGFLNGAVAGGKEHVMDRLNDLDSQINDLKTNVLAEVRELRISATRDRFEVSQEMDDLYVQVHEIWQHLLQAEGRQRGKPQLASERKEFTSKESGIIRHEREKILHASCQTDQEERELRRCADDLELINHNAEPRGNQRVLPRPVRISLLQRCVRSFEDCFKEIRKSEDRFSSSKTTVPRKRRAIEQ